MNSRNPEITPEEREEYIRLITNKHPDIDPDMVVLETDGAKIYYKIYMPRKVLAKMGGTLIGDPDTWNEAKRAEYYDTLPNPID